MPQTQNLQPHLFVSDAKFCVPSGHSSILPRTRLFNEVKARTTTDKDIVVIEGQAGQGKTVLATQLLEQLALPSLWYQVTHEDADPVYLLWALYTGLVSNFTDFRSPVIPQMFTAGEVSRDNLQRLTTILAGDLAASVAQPICMVIDDLHLLNEHLPSLELLTAFIQATRTQVKYICTSRHETPAVLHSREKSGGTVRIPNDLLKLDRTEIAQLFNGYLEIPVDRNDVNHLERLTQGWLAALLVLGERMHTRQLKELRGSISDQGLAGADEFSRYFKEQIFPALSPQLLEGLLKLSLLEAIDLSLAIKLTGDSQIGTELSGLASKNLFVRRLDSAGEAFLIHGLLRNVLLDHLYQTRAEEEIKADLQLAGAYYLGKQQPLQAIRYFLQAADFCTAEQIMSQVGLGLLAVNQTTTLASLLLQIPAEKIRISPWFNFFSGVLGLNRDPAASYVHYETARQLFVAQGHVAGEMAVLAQLIHFHLYVDGRHNLGRQHLHRLEELFLKSREQLNTLALMRFANAIAGGYCFFEFNAAKIDLYSDLAMDYARNLDLPSYLVSARVVNCYRHSFFGNWPAFQKEMEQALPLLGSPRVGLEHKIGLTMAQISVLIMMGDFANYQRKKSWLLEAVGKDVASLSVIAPFLTIYDTNMLIAQDKQREAGDLIHAALREEGPGRFPHQRSQILHFAALLAALNGNQEQALAAAAESRRLRLEVGAGRFDALNQIILGATHALIEDFEVAEDYLSAAIETVESLREEHLLAAACFNRAYVSLRRGQDREARADLARGLAQMKAHSYQFFFGWVPRIMTPLLQFAVDNAIESDTARALAKSRFYLGLSVGQPAVPLLQFRVSGEFTVLIREQKVAGNADFTAIQRQCLALLVCTPGQCLTQEQLQTTLWPDSSPEKARSSFDTMLSRLRKTLGELLGAHPVKHYLVLQKGLLGLMHVETDIQRFRTHADRALAATRKEEYWQAENHFHQAMLAWHGQPFALLPANELIDHARFELEHLYLKTVQIWARLLAGQGRVKDAIELVTVALFLNPTDHELVKALYQLNVQAGLPTQAAKVLQNYRASLEREDYLPADIDDIIESLWDTNAPS